MADSNQVIIEFGAKIDALTKGVDDVKLQLNSLGGAGDSLVGKFGALGAMIAGAFSLDSIKNTIEQMADLGAQTERTAAILGISTQQAGQLGFIAKATGGELAGMAVSIERMQLNLMRTNSTAFTPASEALHSIGIRAKDLIGMPIPDQIMKIADQFVKFADGGNKAAAALAIGGRTFQQMIPVLDKGAAGIKNLMEISDQYGASIGPRMIESLDQIHLSTVKLDAAWTNLKAVLVSTFSTTISGAIEKMADFLRAQSLLIAGGNLWVAQIEELKWLFLSFAADIVRAGMVAKDFFTLDWGKIQSDWEHGITVQEELFRQHLYRMGVLALQGKAEIEKDLAAAGTKPQVPSFGGGADALKAQQTAVESTIKLMQNYYKGQVERYTADVAAYRITATEKVNILIEKLTQTKKFDDATVDYLDKNLAKNKEDHAKYSAMKLKIEQDFLNKLQKLNDERYAALQKTVEGYVSTIESSWNSSLRGLLSGTISFGAAMKKVFGDLIIYMIEQIEKKYIFEVATEKATALIKKALYGEDVVAKTAAEAAKTGAAETGAIARIGISIGEALTSIWAAVAEAFAKLSAFFAGLGPVGIAIAAGLAAGIGAAAVGMIKKFDVGTNYVTQTGLAIIHQGEQVIPAAQGSGPYTGTSGGGAPSVTVNLHGASNMTPSQIQQQARAIAAAVAEVWRFNPSVRPAY